MPCTTILIGKNASYDGSTMMARNEDSGPNKYRAKKLMVVLPDMQPRNYQSVISKVQIALPDDPMRYSAMPNALLDRGIWGEAGFNECNVAMSETETITTNPRVLAADPLYPQGIGEEDMLTITLPYIHSAKEGVLRLGHLIEQYGTYEMNGIGFQDQEEVWWLESIGGHHWIAKRVPDDCYVVMPNQQGIETFDFVDAYTTKKDYLCCEDMVSFIEENFLDVSLTNIKVSENRKFDVRAALGSHSDSDHSYNTPRAWFMLKYLNPHTLDERYTPESDDLPWSMVPEHKVTIEDIKYVLSSYYQGTKYNPYGRYGDLSEAGKYRPIGINRNNFLAITQLRGYVDDSIKALEWICEGSNAFNQLIPFYANVNRVPEYLGNTTATPTTENFYWANRIIGALADSHYNTTIAFIERYQNKLLSIGHAFVKDTDKDLPQDNIQEYLAKCNDQMADIAKEYTYNLLDQVLKVATDEMKNKFSRADG